MKYRTRYSVLTDNERFKIHDGEIEVKRNPIIKVTHVGVCGTDLSYWKEGARHKDLIIGHEYSGVIEEPGSTGLFVKGDRVAGYTQNVFNEPCGHCTNCLNDEYDDCTNRVVHTWKGGQHSHLGAYSQYTTWFPNSIYKLPNGIDQEEAALIEPFTVALHAVRLAEMNKGDKVLILGGGIIGLAISEWVRNFGAAEITITEINQEKIEIIKNYDIVNNVISAMASDIDKQLKEASNSGYDIVFDCAGNNSAINTGIKALKKEFGKKFIAVALPGREILMPYDHLVLNEVVFKGSKGHTYDEFKETARAIEAQDINAKKYISNRIKLSEVQLGFEEIKRKKGGDVKTIIQID